MKHTNKQHTSPSRSPALKAFAASGIMAFAIACGIELPHGIEHGDFRRLMLLGGDPEAWAGGHRDPKPRARPGADSTAQLYENYGRQPLSFIANWGQTDHRVRFLARGPGFSLFLTPTEAVLALHKTKAAETNWKRVSAIAAEKMPVLPGQSSPDSATFRMRFPGGNPHSKISGLDEMSGKVNYFRGKDPGQWRSGMPTYAKTRYEAVYPGVDLIFYGNQRQLEFDFVVAPGVDPGSVKFAFDGAKQVTVDARGDLLLHAKAADVRFRKPVAYQTIAGQRREVAVRFVLDYERYSPKSEFRGNAKRLPEIGFQVAAYDASETLVIDPVLAYSGYLGGDDYDSATAIAVDSDGNAYVTGLTYSANFPTVGAEYPELADSADVFVTKFSADGSDVVYSTYLGGDGWDRGLGIAVDANGNALVTGVTESTDFPMAAALYPSIKGVRDAFLAKFNAGGDAILFSTYLGGTNDDGANAIALDGSGNAYVTGYTYSSDFPVVDAIDSGFGGGFDAFVSKFHAAGSQLIYSTYLGGNEWDSGYDIAVDGSGNAHVTGPTNSTDFPAVNALYPVLSDIGYDPEFFSDAFVSKINASGKNFVYSTYLGGSYLDYGSGIEVDGSGNAYVAGGTESPDFPTVNAVYPDYIGGIRDAFVTKFNAGGSQLVYSTFLGGSLDLFGWDAASGIDVDSKGNAYVTGTTESTDFPSVNALFPELSGFNDAFVTKLSNSGSTVLFSTYLGGADSDYGSGIVLDGAGNAYVTGSTDSADFPTHAGDPGIVSYDPDFNGSDDAFVAKFDFSPQEQNEAPVADAGPDQTVNAGINVMLNGSASHDPDDAPEPLTYSWVQTSGPTVVLTGASAVQPSFVPFSPGIYVFRLVVFDGEAGSPPDSVTVTVNDAAYVSIQAPNGGEVWNEKTRQTIQWGSHNIDSNERMSLYLSVDRGVTWKKIASSKNGSAKNWKIAKNRYLSRQALIKICVKQNESICDVSDSVFTINKAPVADAGIRQKVMTGSAVVLDGSASHDDDNGPSAISFRWRQLSGPLVVLSGDATAAPSFTPMVKGVYRFGLIVNDGAADSKRDKVAVRVRNAP
ncbi:MAG: DUF7948 domain-containing protein [Gammaproteobacteria bacterium]